MGDIDRALDKSVMKERDKRAWYDKRASNSPRDESSQYDTRR